MWRPFTQKSLGRLRNCLPSQRRSYGASFTSPPKARPSQRRLSLHPSTRCALLPFSCLPSAQSTVVRYNPKTSCCAHVKGAPRDETPGPRKDCMPTHPRLCVVGGPTCSHLSYSLLPFPSHLSIFVLACTCLPTRVLSRNVVAAPFDFLRPVDIFLVPIPLCSHSLLFSFLFPVVSKLSTRSCPYVVALSSVMPSYFLQDCHYFYRTALRGLNISTNVSPLYA